MTLIIIEDDVYDVSKYIKSHPGEGIRNVYLHDFNRKDCSNVFDRYHTTNEPFEIIEKAKKYGSFEDVYWVCPNFFGRRVPKYFYFSSDNIEKYPEKKGDFVLQRNEEDISNSVILTIYTENCLVDIKIIQDSDGYWCYDDIEDTKLEKLIEKIVEKY